MQRCTKVKKNMRKMTYCAFNLCAPSSVIIECLLVDVYHNVLIIFPGKRSLRYLHAVGVEWAVMNLWPLNGQR